jgi:hypothetical protein
MLLESRSAPLFQVAVHKALKSPPRCTHTAGQRTSPKLIFPCKNFHHTVPPAYNLHPQYQLPILFYLPNEDLMCDPISVPGIALAPKDNKKLVSTTSRHKLRSPSVFDRLGLWHEVLPPALSSRAARSLWKRGHDGRGEWRHGGNCDDVLHDGLISRLAAPFYHKISFESFPTLYLSGLDFD